jgi:hypothetical protein
MRTVHFVPGDTPSPPRLVWLALRAATSRCEQRLHLSDLRCVMGYNLFWYLRTKKNVAILCHHTCLPGAVIDCLCVATVVAVAIPVVGVVVFIVVVVVDVAIVIVVFVVAVVFVTALSS